MLKYFSSIILFVILAISLEVGAVPAGNNIIISEVQYDPATPAGSASSDVENEAEWFELYNPTASSIDIGSWTIKEGNTPTYTFPSPTIIAAGEYLLVTNRTDRFQLNFPTITPDLEMDPTGAGLLRLNNTGDQLTLKNDLGDTVDFVGWENVVDWTTLSANDGESICRINNTDTDLSADWEACISPTPGEGAGFTLSKTISTINEGATDTFTVVLDTQPANPVVINITTSDSGAVDTLPSTLSVTFSSADWDTPQTVNLSAIQDADLFDENAIITASIDIALSDIAFDALIDQSVTITVNDDDLTQLSIDDVSHVEGVAGTTDYIFTIGLDQISPDNVSVVYRTSDGTAESTDGDYVAVLFTTVTILAGDTSATVVVRSKGDNKVESNETFNVDLSMARNATIVDAQGVGTITNDDAAQISIDNVTQVEGNTGNSVYSFTISIDKPSDTNITVDYVTADNSARVADSDYTAIVATQATIVAGSTSTTITINGTGDKKVESTETFFVNLSNPSGATINDAQGLGTITNDDFAQISIDDVTQAEGDSGNTAYSFTISIDKVSDTDVTVDYATADDLATMTDVDYVDVAATQATIITGSTSTTITVNGTGDNKVESTETFFVNLSNPSGATINDAQGLGTITNDDSAQISIDDVTLSEGDSGNTVYSFTISIDKQSDTDVTVNYATTDDSATTADSDYTAVAITQATITSGSTTTTIMVNGTGDNKVESTETFFVNLTNPSGASINDGQGLGTITNDDATQITINDVSHIEGDSSITNYTFTISINNPSSEDIKVTYTTADGTATSNDYTAVTAQATINAGEVSTTIEILVAGDILVENNETFTVNLISPIGATISDAQGIGSITNNDDAGFSITPALIQVDEGSTDSFTVVLTAQPISDVVVDIISADTGAVSLSSGSLIFTPINWSTPRSITVKGTEDGDLNDENVTITTSINSVSDSLFSSLADQTLSVSVTDTSDPDIGIKPDLDTDNDGNPDSLDPHPLVPSASNDDLTGEAGAGIPVTINILSNDDFIAGTEISITNTGNGSAIGVVSFDPASGEMTYTPEAQERDQVVSVEYRVCNTAATPDVCAVAIVKIAVAKASEPIPPTSIPTLSEWMLMMLSLFLLLIGSRRRLKPHSSG